MTNRQARGLAAALRVLTSPKPSRATAEVAFTDAYFAPKRSEVNDLYGSNKRRAEQAERDAKTIAQPVAATFIGTGLLNLRPLADRPVTEPRTAEALDERRERKKNRRSRRKQFTSPDNRRWSAL